VKIIVGLGNPGPQYRNTRHNLGFEVLDALARRLNTGFTREKHQGQLGEAVWSGEKLLLVKPLTFMNRSGDCVAAVVRNKVDTPADVLVVVDEVNLPLGTLRLRAGGSAGGHNGLKSLIERLGTQDFPRLRMGMGDGRAGGALADYVLARFHPDEFPVVKEMIDKGVEAVLSWVSEGAGPAMSKFNR
jgi:peptidyl-tRNA hydrolase, PTH1 family